jgi:hypothetical protein
MSSCSSSSEVTRKWRANPHPARTRARTHALAVPAHSAERPRRSHEETLRAARFRREDHCTDESGVRQCWRPAALHTVGHGV